MGKGRPKTPIEVMKARSPDGKTPGKRELAIPESQTTPDRTVPALPEGITGRGIVEWERIWTAGFWLKRDQDWPWVEMIARAYADMDVYRHEVAEMGLTVTGYAGQTVANPLLAEIRKLEATIQKCLQVLGFSPTDRAKLVITEAKAQDAFEAFVQRRRDKTQGAD
jgi:P27 family predicted phage terminase small subunit